MKAARALRRIVPPAVCALALAAPRAGQVEWIERSPGEPLPRYRHGLAFDAARGETVLFSGAPNPSADTWVLDAGTWSRRESPVSPSPQTGHPMVYDTVRGVVVLYGRSEFGPQIPETFEWDGTRWHDRTPLVLPSNRDRTAMAFDAARGVSVLFGGHFFFTPKDDTWEWNGSAWSLRTPLTRAPEARAFHAMAFDAARGRTVLFGGFGTNALLGDTWAWDGSDWTDLAPPASPPPRELHAVAFDSGRGRIVLHGGFEPNGAGALDDTWEFDGTTWILRFPAHRPPPVFDHAMTYDSVRGRTLLVGGTLGILGRAVIWEWDGDDWTRAEERVPPARQRHALAHDPVRDRTVLFGGFQDPVYLDDTWEWDGSEWTEAVPLVPPPAAGERHRASAGRPAGRVETALAFDARRETMVMFGGQRSSSRALDDTWEWDGVTWVERLVPVRPPARHGHAMAYDRERGRLVLFGGREDLFSPSFADTWEWDGRAWEQRFPASSPPGREDFAMVWDSVRKRVVLFAGEFCPPFDECTPRGDTWEWDGEDWRRVATSGPPARAYHGMAFDRARARVVLHGGVGLSGRLGDDWEWDGQRWVERDSEVEPPVRQEHALAFDEARGSVIAFGGLDEDVRVRSDTWERRVGCDVFGAGHPGGGLALACIGAPLLGAQLCLVLDDPAGTGASVLLAGEGPCRSAIAGRASPGLCAPGALFLRPDAFLGASVLPALHCQTVPADPALAGATFCFQGAAREPGCWRLTDALSVTFHAP